MSKDNIARLTRLLVQGFGAGDWSVVDDVVAETFVEHQAGMDGDREHLKEVIRVLRTAFPDLRYWLIQATGEGDKVWAHFRARGLNRGPFMGRPPTGRQMEIDVIDIARFENGKIVEHWGVPDRLSCLLQLGHLPSKP